jgi:UDP-N-acetylmuramoyl-tripeptide--D-alanyl-D-alanine ligase
MEQLSIHQVATWTGGQYEGPELPVRGVAIDSRTAAPGQLFVALRGSRVDGHDYLGEAFASGAAAALVDRPDVARAHRAMGRPVLLVPDARRALGDLAAAYRASLDLKVVGITGSCGKTTTKEMLRLLLGDRAIASPQSFNNDLGVPLTLLSARRTHAFCIVEMGTNGPGEIAALARIARPQVGIVLNVGTAHLERLGDIEGVAREKFALVEALGPAGCAVLNWDDERTRAMMEAAPCPALSFGTWPHADVFADDIRTSGYSLGFRLFHRRRVTMRLIGVHNVHNALAAAAAALWLGEHPWDVCERLKLYRPAPMRMAVEEIGRIRLINDAYNANPRSMAAALHEMSYRAGGRRIAVLGDMLELGEQAATLHAEIGRSAARARIDVLWAIGPLSEATARAARDAGLRHVHWSPSVTEAVERPPVRVKSRDVVLFKASRAMALERVYEVVKEGIEQRRRPAVARECDS